MSIYLKTLRQIDPVLTELAQGYRQAELIAEQIAPQVFVDKEGIQVPTYGKGAVLTYKTDRAPRAASNVIELDRAAFMPVVLEEHDLAAGVDYREQAESMFDERAKASRRVAQGVQLRQEIETANLVQSSAAYAAGLTQDLSKTKQWSDDAADPVADIAAARAQVRRACGMVPNVLVLGATVYDRLVLHPAIKAYLAGTERKILTADILKNLFEVDDIIVGRAVAANSDKSATTDVWGKFAALMVRPTLQAAGNDDGVQSFAYTFRRRGMPLIDRYPSEGGKMEYVRYTDIRKPAVVGGACGYLFDKALA